MILKPGTWLVARTTVRGDVPVTEPSRWILIQIPQEKEFDHRTSVGVREYNGDLSKDWR